MDEKETVQTIPYVAHEAAMGRMENIVHRLFVVVIILIVLLVGTNAGWIWYEAQWEDMTITQENADGYNNFIRNDGDIIYGETNHQGQTP